MGNTCAPDKMKHVETTLLDFANEPIVTLLPCYSPSIVDNIGDFESYDGSCFYSEFIPLEELDHNITPFSLYRIQSKATELKYICSLHSFTPFFNERSESESQIYYSQQKFYQDCKESEIDVQDLKIIPVEKFILSSYSSVFNIHTYNYAIIFQDVVTSYQEIIEYRKSQKKLGVYSLKEIKFLFLEFAKIINSLHRLGYASMSIAPNNFFIVNEDVRAVNMNFLKCTNEKDGTDNIKAKFCPSFIRKFLPEFGIENAYFSPKKADIYMLGLFFLSILTLESDFDSLDDPSYRNFMMKSIREVYPDPNLILEKMLEGEPSDRPDLHLIIDEIENIRVERANPVMNFKFETCTNSHWSEIVKLSNPIVSTKSHHGFYKKTNHQKEILNLSIPEKISKLMFFSRIGNKEELGPLLDDISNLVAKKKFEQLEDYQEAIMEISFSIHSNKNLQTKFHEFLKSYTDKIMISMNSSANANNRITYLFCRVLEAQRQVNLKDYRSALEILESQKDLIKVLKINEEYEKLVVSLYYSGLFVCQSYFLHNNILQTLDEWEAKLKNVKNTLCVSLIDLLRGDYFIANADISQGRAMKKMAVREMEVFLGTDHLFTALTRCYYGLALINEGFVPDGIEQIHKAYAVTSKFSDSHSKMLHSAKFFLAIAEFRAGNINKSISLFTECLEFAEKLDADHPFIIGISNNLSSLYLELHDNDSAAKYNQKALSLKNSLISKCTLSLNDEIKVEEDEIFIHILNNQTLIHFLNGRKEDSEEVLAKAYELSVKLRGLQRSHFNIEKAFFTLLMTSALLSDFFGRKDTALKTLKICEQVKEKSFTKFHPDMLQVKINISKLLADQRNLETAYAIMSDILEKTLYGDYSISMGILKHNMACLYREAGETERSDSLFEDALSIFSEFPFGKGNYYNALVNSNLAAFELFNGNNAFAQEYLVKGNEFMATSDEYYINIFLKNNAAIVNYRYGFVMQALELLYQAYESIVLHVGNHHPIVATIECNIATCYVALQELTKANLMYEKAFQKKEAFHRIGDHNMLPCLYNLCISMKNNVEVGQLFMYCIEKGQKQYSEKDIELGDLYSLLSDVSSKRNLNKEAIDYCKRSVEIYEANEIKCEKKLEAAKDTLRAMTR